MRNSWSLNRRTFLRGTGISLAIPFLNAMAGSNEAKTIAKLPRRAAFLFFPNGVSLPSENDPQFEDWHWYPKGKGRNYTFRKNLESLNPYKQDISVIHGLSHTWCREGGDPHINPSAFLTGKRVNKQAAYNAVSIDQVITKEMGRQTQLSSLVLSSVGGTGNMARAFTLSFDQKGKAIPALSNLRDIYKRMYLANTPEGKAVLNKKIHLINDILPDAKDMMRKVGKEDKQVIDEYLASMTDLEKKIANDKLWAAKVVAQDKPNINLDIQKTDVENYIQSIYELIYLAFKSDITRVATYQIASEGGTSPVVSMSKYIGMSKDLHGLSHSSTKGDSGFKDWGLWDQFLAKQFAVLIKKLKDTKEGGSSLLDRCLIFKGASTSKVHDNHNFPILLAGGKSLGHKAGQYVKYVEKDNNLCNLFVRMANAMDVPITNFGESTGVQMSELF